MENDGRHDFDFLVGTWVIHNRRLRERLSGCDEWESFAGTSEGRLVLGGIGNLDTCVFDWNGQTLHGLTIRLFNPATREWSLNWSDSESGVFFPPMVGRFRDGVGWFYGQELCNGATVYSRFIWSNITETSARWEQSFSADGGTSWECNWVMEFTKSL